MGDLHIIRTSERQPALLEGADGWVYFWKITFPYVSPFILANLIFTVIDTFTSPMNTVMKRILTMRSEFKFGEASAMAWIYFGIILASISLATAVIKKSAYYDNQE